MPLETKQSTSVNDHLHTVAWLVKRRRALLESTPLRNSQLETHPDDGSGALTYEVGVLIGWIDFLMPLKLIKRNRRGAASFFHSG